MAASVRVEDEAFSDARIYALGELAGYNHFEALGRMAHLWRLCTQRGIYVVSDVLVCSCLGRNGVEAILGAELGERTAGGIRVKGTDGRIEWLGVKRAGSVAGGKARAAKAKREVGGQFASSASREPPDAGDVSQVDTSREPGRPSPPAPALIDIQAPGVLKLHEVEQIGYPKCKQLCGSGAAAIQRLMPIGREELDLALKTNAKNWTYLARVIESMREESSKPAAPSARSPPEQKTGAAWREFKPEEIDP